ncbi:hypothetical protein BBJ28_00008651 [Nothophytophthora sp. Chile5]|nr:hypothetical protein BBJ28_00008651 [Nothophytophthora sp. Chile5]
MDEELEANIQRALPSALKMALFAANKQYMEILKYTIEGQDALCSNAAFLKDFEDEEHLELLDETAKEFVVVDAQLARYKQQLKKMEPLVESGKLDQKKIDKMIQDSLVTPRVNATKHDFYKRFCDKAGIELAQDGDEDVVFQESESTRSTICPVTQMEMERPLRNPSCNHTYSEKGIRSHLLRSKKCPVAGCPQKLTFNHLERDVEMEAVGASDHRFDDEDEDEEEYVVE